MRTEESYIGSEIDAWRGTLLLFEQNVGENNAISFAETVIKSIFYLGESGLEGEDGGGYIKETVREREGGSA